MMTLFWLVFWAGLAALVFAAGVTMHVRRKESIAAPSIVVDDMMIEKILETGQVFVDDEPLDMKDIDDEEERFWSESWDEPSEEW